MKPGGPLARRTPLRVDPAKLDAWRRRSGRLRWRSAKVEDEAAERFVVRTLMLARDGHRCALAGASGAPSCAGPLTPHHRRKASAGGAYSLTNLVALCAGHNGWVEDQPLDARALRPDLVVREGDAEWAALGSRRDAR